MPAQPLQQPLGDPERATLLQLLALTAPTRDATHAACDWNALMDYVSMGLSPLVARGLDEGRIAGAIPPPVIARVQSNRRALAARQVRFQATLRVVCEALSRASVPVIVLKGAALATGVYADASLRPMTDLDMWVPPKRLDEAVAALAPHDLGYPPQQALKGPVAVPQTQARPRVLTTPRGDVVLELHGELRSLDGLDCADFARAWEAAEPAARGIAARVLGPEHLLTHVCLHAARNHAFKARLLQVVDIALVTRRWADRWDWNALLADWQRQRVTTWMLLSLVLARDLLGAPVPEDLEARAVLPPQWNTIRSLATERLWSARLYPLPPAVASMVGTRGAAARLRLLRERLIDHYWRSSEVRDPWRAVLDAARRAWYDVRYRVPAYARAWKTGALRGQRLARAIALERDGSELERLILANGELGYSPPPAAGPRVPVGGAIAAGPAL